MKNGQCKITIGAEKSGGLCAGLDGQGLANGPIEDIDMLPDLAAGRAEHLAGDCMSMFDGVTANPIEHPEQPAVVGDVVVPVAVLKAAGHHERFFERNAFRKHGETLFKSIRKFSG